MPTAEHVLLRTVCGAHIGLGHFRRSLTLAEALLERGAQATLAVACDEASVEMVERCGVPVHVLSAVPSEPNATLDLARMMGARLLVVDDYAVSDDSLRAWKTAGLRVGVIDDLADRSLEVDLVLNGAPNAEQLGYRAEHLLLGPRYALLRAAFRDVPVRAIPSHIERAFVMLGGSDPQGLTATVAAAVRAALPEAHLDVIVGPLTHVQLQGDAQLTLHRAPPELPAIMRRAELAVSAAGQSLYELAACGVPTLAIEVAANQRPQLSALVEAGVIVEASRDAATLALQVRSLAADLEQRRRMVERGTSLVDGRGSLRAADAILERLGRSNHG